MPLFAVSTSEPYPAWLLWAVVVCLAAFPFVFVAGIVSSVVVLAGRRERAKGKR